MQKVREAGWHHELCLSVCLLVVGYSSSNFLLGMCFRICIHVRQSQPLTPDALSINGYQYSLRYVACYGDIRLQCPFFISAAAIGALNLPS